jgi:endonuclease/exonuclease/phosphatase family metal-dependent hydrolase
MNKRATRAIRLANVVEAIAVFVFFYQALRILFSALFGLIYDALFAEKASMAAVGLVLVAAILALLSPLAAPRKPGRRRIVALASAVLVFVARIPLTLNDPQVRLVASILIVAAAGLYLATRLREGSRDVVRALILALLVDQLLRAFGHTWDVTLRPAWLWGQVALSLGLCLLASWFFRQRPIEKSEAVPRLGLLLGLVWAGWLFLQSSLLNFPNAMARWGDERYLSFVAVWPVVVLFPFFGDAYERALWGWRDGLVFSAILLAGLAAGYLLSDMGTALGLLMAQWASLVSFTSCFLSSHDIRSTPRPRGGAPEDGARSRLGPALALGGILFLVLSFAHAFTFTYPYTLEFFRDMGLPIFLAAGLLAGLPALCLPARTERPTPTSRARMLAIIAVGLVIMAAISVFVLPRSQPQLRAGDSLHIATYNIHYGYDTGWHLSLEEQAQAIEASGADVVMLQEVDTGRPTSYMIDDALWLARRLDMEAVYLPTMEYLTGIALLSRFPVLDTETLLLPSELEQTGIIWAELDVGGAPLNAFATWLGLEPEERAHQLDAALPFIEAHPGPAVFGADFNSTPGSPVYARIEAAGFVDPFVALGLGSPLTSPAIDPTERIDFVWLRGLVPRDARVSESVASDHRLVVVEGVLDE